MKRYLAFLPAVSLFFAQAAYAGTNDIVDNIDLGSAQGNIGIAGVTNINTIFTNAITIVFTVAALLVLVMLIWGGLEWVMSGGDKEKVGNARKRIIASLIGLAIIALAFLIVRVVGGVLGFDILRSFSIPSLDKTPPVTQ